MSQITSATNSSHTALRRDSLTFGDSGDKGAGGSFTPSQTRAILIAGLSCACFSLAVVLVALRWFLLMRRSFRHRLVMYLIISDTFKALWYFVFPAVVFARGPVQSSSKFCQASGFLLALSIEASDMAILVIALHSILYVLHPNSSVGEGGLYPYRKWIYLIWLGPPLLAASLAFVDDKAAYVTAGTFCYLPKRPFWYRLALSWVPRYLIVGMILLMYFWIYMYVHVKFHGFDNLRESDSSNGSNSGSRRKSGFSTRSADVKRKASGQSICGLRSTGLQESPRPSGKRHSSRGCPSELQRFQPWDAVDFVTTKPLQDRDPEIVAEDEVAEFPARDRGWSGETQMPSTDAAATHVQPESPRSSSRTTSEAAPTSGENNGLDERQSVPARSVTLVSRTQGLELEFVTNSNYAQKVSKLPI